MYNDTDERRRNDQPGRRSRHREAREEVRHYAQDDVDARDDYAQGGNDFAADTGDTYADYSQDDDYNDGPGRRSRLVPILSIVAAVLVVAIGVGALLYFLGVFGGSDRPVSTAAPTAVDTPAVPGTPDAGEQPIRAVDSATAPTLPTDGAPPSPANPSIPDAVVSVAPPAQGEPPVRSVHDAWQVRCDTPAGAQDEQCVLMQFVTAEDRENVGLTVIILKTADQQARIMRILAPLGVLLPSGLGLKIDEADIGRAGFVRCLPNGCVAEVILEDQLLDQLEKGNTATFIIFQTPEEGIGIPISLAGFGQGFTALP